MSAGSIIAGVIIGLVVATFTILVERVISGMRERTKSAAALAVMAFTVNEQSRAIGSLETVVGGLERKVANFEGVLQSRMNYRRRGE